MSCVNELLMGMQGWLYTVARKMRRDRTIQIEDLVQEGSMAVLKSGATDEALAKTVAIRAMTKYRNANGLTRVVRQPDGTYHQPVPRSDYDDLTKLTVADEPTGIFWDNLEADPRLSADGVATLKALVESDRTTSQLAEEEGVSPRAIRERLDRTTKGIRDRWDGVPAPAEEKARLKSQAQEMRKSGLSFRAIADQLGISDDTARRYVGGVHWRDNLIGCG